MISSDEEARVWLRGLPECDRAVLERFELFVGLLRSENAKQNLVAASSLDQVWSRHIADSAQLTRYVPRETSDWLDLGTGAGFPGLVVAILRLDCAVTLVEARTLRIDWLKRICDALELRNVTIAGTKVERLGDATFGAISARAFAPLDKLLSLAARFSTKDTIWVLPKGRSGEQELQALKGWRHKFHVEQSLTNAEASVIVGTVDGQDRRQ